MKKSDPSHSTTAIPKDSSESADPEEFCRKMNEWAALMSKSSGRISEPSQFSQAWSVVHLAISKSCLLSRTLYGGEKPSQTPCPVHQGKWSGCHFGHIPQDWLDVGCRCFQHGCGCTTGWQPDEHCGCVTTQPEDDRQTATEESHSQASLPESESEPSSQSADAGELISQLRSQAAEIAAEGHKGWGNTMLMAADALQQATAEIEALKAERDGLKAECRSRIGQQKEDQEVGNAG